MRTRSPAFRLVLGVVLAAATGAKASVPACEETALAIQQKSIAVHDKYLAPVVRGSPYSVNIAFLGYPNPLVGHRITGVSDLGGMVLDDDSTLMLVRNVDSDGAIRGAIKSSPACRSDWGKSSRITATENPYAGLRLETVGQTSRLLQVRSKPGAKSLETPRPLIVADRHIDGFAI